MASHEIHYLDCVNKLGRPFPEVHEFLDSHHKEFGHRHRRVLHNTHGVEMVRWYWGDEAAKAAEIHILRDIGEIPEPEDYFDADSWLYLM